MSHLRGLVYKSCLLSSEDLNLIHALSKSKEGQGGQGKEGIICLYSVLIIFSAFEALNFKAILELSDQLRRRGYLI